MQLRERGLKVFGRAGKSEDGLLCRLWSDFKGYLGDDAQRSQRAYEELAKIITGHVFDDSPAGFDLVALVVDRTDADDIIAQRAIAIAARAADVDGEHAAHGGPVGVRHIDRKALFFGCQN